ncbi:MAG: hypothetical protein EBQ96_02800 [Proteobacteria bacterium]|nr:hypothetical protein [Pseudomonadota bacterium]
MGLFHNIIGLFKKPEPQEAEHRDIRYAHPSHVPEGNRTLRVANVMRPKTIGGYEDRAYISNLRSMDFLKSLTFAYLQKIGAKGATPSDINEAVLTGVLASTGRTPLEIATAQVLESLRMARSELKREGKIEFNAIDRVWYPKEKR